MRRGARLDARAKNVREGAPDQCVSGDTGWGDTKHVWDYELLGAGNDVRNLVTTLRGT